MHNARMAVEVILLVSPGPKNTLSTEFINLSLSHLWTKLNVVYYYYIKYWLWKCICVHVYSYIMEKDCFGKPLISLQITMTAHCHQINGLNSDKPLACIIFRLHWSKLLINGLCPYLQHMYGKNVSLSHFQVIVVSLVHLPMEAESTLVWHNGTQPLTPAIQGTVSQGVQAVHVCLVDYGLGVCLLACVSSLSTCTQHNNLCKVST